MGITDWLRRNGDIVEKVLGPLDDIIVKSKASDAFKELGKYEQKYKDWLNIRNINKKLSGYQIGEDDINSLVKNKISFNDGFGEDETIKGSPLYQEYQKNAVSLQGPPTSDGKTPGGDYLSYLQGSNNEDEINRLKGLGYLKEDVIQPSKDDLSNHIANKILTPEEVGIYNKLKNESFDPVMHNMNLKDFVVKNRRNLISTGPAGKDFADELIDRAGLLQMQEDKPEDPLIRFDEKNNVMIGYDKQGNIKFTKKYTADDKKEEKNSFGKYGTMSFDEILNLPPNEVYQNFGAFSSEMQDKLKTQYPTLFAEDTETGSNKSSGRHFKGPGKLKDTNQMNPNEKVFENLLNDFNEVKISLGNKWIDEPKDDEELSDSDKEQLKKQKKYTELKESIKNMGINDPDYAAVKYGNTSMDKKTKKQDVLNNIKSLGNYRGQIQNWQGKIEESWGRYDLTPEDWIGEMEKHGMFNNTGDEGYYEALKDWFHEKTGRNLEDYGNFE